MSVDITPLRADKRPVATAQPGAGYTWRYAGYTFQRFRQRGPYSDNFLLLQDLNAEPARCSLWHAP